MNAPDDPFREYFRTVTPTTFPPCPTPPAVVPAAVDRRAWQSRAVLALAAGLLLTLGLTFAPNGPKKSPTAEPSLLNDATAKGVKREVEKSVDAKRP